MKNNRSHAEKIGNSRLAFYKFPRCPISCRSLSLCVQTNPAFYYPPELFVAIIWIETKCEISYDMIFILIKTAFIYN
jgi:hypothetical protein